jgi:hypothetical protein
VATSAAGTVHTIPEIEHQVVDVRDSAESSAEVVADVSDSEDAAEGTKWKRR